MTMLTWVLAEWVSAGRIRGGREVKEMKPACIHCSSQ